MKHLIGIIIFVLVLSSCGGSDTKPVPRRDAYPRVACYAPEYVLVDALPLAFEANKGVVVNVEKAEGGNYWANISYPAYAAKIYITFSPTDNQDLKAAAENRMERIRLNLNGVPFNVEEVDGDNGMYAMLVCAPSAMATPVQFITTDEADEAAANWLISGAIAFDALPDNAAVDSLAPMVETMKRDLVHAITTMKPNASK